MDLFRLLHAVLYGTETPVYSKYPREAAASTCLVIIFRRIVSGIPSLLCSTAVPMQLPHCRDSVTVSECTDAGRGSIKQPTIECSTSVLSLGMNGVNLSSCYSGNYLT